MHEMSIAADLFEQLNALIAEHRIVRIEAIELEVGVLRLVVPEAMQAAFAAMAEGTCAAGAILTLTETPAEAQCRHCGAIFGVTVEQYLCPQCKLAEANILSGNDIIIKSLACESEESGAANED